MERMTLILEVRSNYVSLIKQAADEWRDHRPFFEEAVENMVGFGLGPKHDVAHVPVDMEIAVDDVTAITT